MCISCISSNIPWIKFIEVSTILWCKDVDKIKDKILFFHFDNNFKTKASKLIKEDKQKIFLLNFIGSITAGKKELFT